MSGVAGPPFHCAQCKYLFDEPTQFQDHLRVCSNVHPRFSLWETFKSWIYLNSDKPSVPPTRTIEGIIFSAENYFYPEKGILPPNRCYAILGSKSLRKGQYCLRPFPCKWHGEQIPRPLIACHGVPVNAIVKERSVCRKSCQPGVRLSAFCE